MATADVRAVWQRAVNRCFIQEDAKRAPKLACVQSSCATSKLFDAGAASAADKSDHADVNVTHFNQKSSFSSLTPDSRWWLQLQTNNGFKKGLTYEQLNALEDEIENFKFCNENKTCKGDASFGDENHDYSSSKEGIKEVYGKNSQLYSHPMDMMAKNETMEIDSVVCSVSKQTNDIFSDSDYSWIGIEKPQPWWRTTDRDELACFISRKLLKHFENCDLPPPKKYLWGQPCADNSDIKIRTSSFNWEAKSSVTSEFYFNFRTKGSLEPGLMHRSWGLQPIKDIHILIVTNIQAQLMEALCHSQARAREAEEVAKQAYAEKEHIIALFYIQASQLFAHKQWFQLLQLEALNTQVKSKDQPISTHVRVALPRIGRKLGKRKLNFCSAKPAMLGKQKSDITTYAVAMALGLSLVGSGLLLGWTVGCMLPSS